eukprot:134195-Rhodomonas_salina.1
MSQERSQGQKQVGGARFPGTRVPGYPGYPGTGYTYPSQYLGSPVHTRGYPGYQGTRPGHATH